MKGVNETAPTIVIMELYLTLYAAKNRVGPPVTGRYRCRYTSVHAVPVGVESPPHRIILLLLYQAKTPGPTNTDTLA